FKVTCELPKIFFSKNLKIVTGMFGVSDIGHKKEHAINVTCKSTATPKNLIVMPYGPIER
ncbi:unnamed protein product, partial [Porites evermanni]